jgi:hypothetical protein
MTKITNSKQACSVKQSNDFVSPVSNNRFQASEYYTFDASFETTPKWHGFLMIKLAAFQAGSAARIKLPCQ